MVALKKYQPSAAHLEKVARGLGHLPLATAPELAHAFGLGVRWVYDSLAILQERGRVSSIEIGAVGRRSRRWWLAGVGDHRHDENTVVRLMDNPLSLHWVYYMLPLIAEAAPGRRLKEFSWFRRRAFDAAARFNDGWVAFVWSGFWQTRKALRLRFERFSATVREEQAEERSWPSLFCFVAADRWQAQLVLDVAAEFGMTESVCVCTVDEKLLFGLANYRMGEGRGWLLPPVGGVSLERGSVQASLERSLTRWGDSSYLLRLMLVIEQWPGITLRSLSMYSRSAWSAARDGLERLTAAGLVREKGNGYVATAAWLAAAARRDRVWLGLPGKVFSEANLDKLYLGRIAEHEKGLMLMMRAFALDGCAFAAGWRCVDTMGRSGKVAPDAAVWIEHGPFDAGWHYVEYELRARQPSHVAPKLRGYKAALRADRYPVLLVCRLRMEEAFREAGAGINMLTTTVQEARSGPLTGHDGTVWRNNRGEPVGVLSGRTFMTEELISSA